MRPIFIIFLIKLTYSSAKITDQVHDAGPLSDEEYKQLPAIFHIDNYNECVEDPANNFCRIKIKILDSKKNDSKIWKIIQKTTISSKYFSYDELLHAICIKNNTEIYPRKGAEMYVMEKLQLQEFNVNITLIDCKHNDLSLLEIRRIDLIFLGCLILYCGITMIVTFRDQSRLSRLTRPFSIKQNWTKLKKMYENIESNSQLKAIQALRFYTMVVIILCHTYLSLHGTFLADTKYVEDFADNPLKNGLLILFMFLVQCFFIISGLLLAWNSFKIFQRNPKISSVRYFCISAMNRYLRLFPPLFLEICIMSTVWIQFFFRGPVKSLYIDREYTVCKKWWWTCLTFISNHYNSGDTCYMIGWYLAADFQLYILSLIVLIFLWKYQNRQKSILFGLMACGMIVHGLLVYWNNFDVILRLLPKRLNVEAFHSFEASVNYTSSYTNLASYMLGLGFGIALFKHTQKPFFAPNKENYTLWACFCTFPLCVLILASFTYNSVITGILAAVLKPIFAFGVGIGLFGMSQGMIGGCVRKVFEWKPAVFLGNITYSTYVAHYPIVFARAVIVHQPKYVSDTTLVTAFVQDLFLSFGAGFLMYLLIEMPFSQLQSIFVPKLGANVKKDEKNPKSS